MPRAVPSRAQSFLSSIILPLLSLYLIPVSLTAVVLCVLQDKVKALLSGETPNTDKAKKAKPEEKSRGCVIISGGRMSKGLHLARAFKRAGWEVIGVEERGWGDLCPLRFSSAISHFYLLPLASSSYPLYSSTLTSIAKRHSATLFIPVSGAGSSVEDARAADAMYAATSGRCKTFIQDPETMEDLHDKDKFMQLVARMGMPVPRGKMVQSVQEAMDFLEGETEPRYVLKCMGLDENRGDMTLFPLKSTKKTRERLQGLKLGITSECPYVFQEFIPGQEYCTHASVTDGHLTSFLVCPSNDMLMTYQDATSTPVGRAAEQWTLDLLSRMRNDPTPSGNVRRLTGHFSFDFIKSERDGRLYPIECNARVHTAVVLLPLDEVAGCYDSFVSKRVENGDGGHKQSVGDKSVLRPAKGTLPRSWAYNNLVMRLLPALIPSKRLLGMMHPSLPACLKGKDKQPDEGVMQVIKEPTLVADDWVPFLVLWHVWWPALLVQRWWRGVRWTRLNASTARIFEA